MVAGAYFAGFLPRWVFFVAVQVPWLIDDCFDQNHRGVAFMLREAEISNAMHDASFID
jgi:hypothetical protein